MEHQMTDLWSEPHKERLDEMTEALSRRGMVVPRIPESLASRLMQFDRQFIWSTSRNVEHYDVYFILRNQDPSTLIDYLSPDKEDFVLLGATGHGMNSYGFGIVARIGPLFVAQQDGWGGVYSSNPNRVDEVNRSTEAWNLTCATLEESSRDEIRVAILYSSYRGYAQIWVKEPDGNHAPHSANFFHMINLPYGEELRAKYNMAGPKMYDELLPWNVVEDGAGEGLADRLDQLATGADPIVAIAARHLRALLIQPEETE